MASSSKTRYGWQFPDGTVIPVDEKYKVKDKLLESDRFLGKLSNDELRGGNLYSEAYNLDLEYLVEDGYDNPDYFMEMYGVTIVDRGGPEEDRFRLRASLRMGRRTQVFSFACKSGSGRPASSRPNTRYAPSG